MRNDTKLHGMKVAVLVAEGFEQAELTEPVRALRAAGAEPLIVSPSRDRVQGWRHFDAGDTFDVDVPLAEAEADEFDALLLPGGVANPDQLRVLPQAVQLVREFFRAGKPVAAICHGPWLLVEAGVVDGRRMTSWPSLHTDLVNAGARWVDAEVVVDDGLVTSRKPDDLPAFNRKMIEEFAEGFHARQAPRNRSTDRSARQAGP